MIRTNLRYQILFNLCFWLKRPSLVYVPYEWDGETLKPVQFRATKEILDDGVRRSQLIEDEYRKTGYLPNCSLKPVYYGK